MAFIIRIEGLDRMKAAVRRSPQDVHNGLTKAIKTSVNLIRPVMASETPVDTGALRKNIYARSSGLKGEVGPSTTITPYAIYVHEGTKAHTIRPRTKKALYWAGAKHPVKMVRHPGTKANPFVERTYNKTKQPVIAIFKQEMDKFTKGFNR